MKKKIHFGVGTGRSLITKSRKDRSLLHMIIN